MYTKKATYTLKVKKGKGRQVIVNSLIIYSQLLRLSAARGLYMRFFLVGLTKVKRLASLLI